MRKRHGWSGRTVLGGLALTLAVSGPAVAQSDLAPTEGFGNMPRLGIGYVTNSPEMFSGVGGYVVLDVLGGLGLYVDGKLGLNSPAGEVDYVDSLTVRDVDGAPGMNLELEESGWWSVNAAVLRPISPELMLYLGGGYAYDTRFRRYRDASMELGTFGYYWVRDEEASGGRLNVLGGAFFRMSESLALQFGAEMEPPGFTVGLSYSLSLR